MANIFESESGQQRAINPPPKFGDPNAAMKFNDLLAEKHGEGGTGKLDMSNEIWLRRYRADARMTMSDSTKDEIRGFAQLFAELPSAFVDLFDAPTRDEIFQGQADRAANEQLREIRADKREARQEGRGNAMNEMMTKLGTFLFGEGAPIAKEEFNPVAESLMEE